MIGKKIRKKEKEKKRSKGTCGGEKKRGEKRENRRKYGTCVEEKKRWEKKGKKEEGNAITIFSQSFHNKF